MDISQDGPPDISLTALSIGAMLVLIPIYFSQMFKLNLTSDMVISTFRATLQLLLLGSLLVACFTAQKWWVPLLFSLFSGSIAAWETSDRSNYTYQGIYFNAWKGVFVPCLLILFFSMVFIIKIQPFWMPQYFIPLIGAMLGYSINLTSIALKVFVQSVHQNSKLIEDRLARGASKHEAMKPEIKHSLVTSFATNLNEMRILGLVWIPGMMVGQLLAGVSATHAARYQLILICMNCSASSLGAFVVVDITYKLLFDDECRFCKWKLS
eukprot:CAMPEP_0171463356 /NCGR_PEP_ID=MMETSP0945-20130129/7062_1 /TAXON_ID=109269 /ORGANISM="Vaucheria litorea, Strain CCMP2940" /LENGTH=266 /DNA_ID=CAMNT_0011990137 /DNA_START=80 /DNA_END=877 /DNA_ORIENTATION=-